MIGRIWRGRTHTEDVGAYLEVLRSTGVRDYRATPGNHGIWIFTRRDGDQTEFTVLTLWSSREAIARFSGPEIEKARYYPDDVQFLLDFPSTVEHIECPLAIAGALAHGVSVEPAPGGRHG